MKLLLTLLLGILNHPALAQWYLGGAIGSGYVQSGSTSLDATLAAQGITAKSTVNSRDTDYKIYAGYRIDRRFSLEAGYMDLGRVTASGTFSSPLPGGTFSDGIRAHGWNFDLVGSIPLSEDFSACLRLGVVRAEIKSNIIAYPNFGFAPVAISRKATSNGRHYGVGVQYSLSGHWKLNGEWEKIDKVGDPNSTGEGNISITSLGIAYLF